MKDRTDCFAKINDTTCNALTKKECSNCKFYQPRTSIRNNPFYAYSYDDIKQLKRDLNIKNIKIEEVIW